MLTSPDETLRPSSVISDDLTLEIKDKLDKIRLKLEKQKKGIRIRQAISKIFVFNSEWKRKHFECVSMPNADVTALYQNATFDNQRNFGADIYKAFEDLNTTHVLAVAPTQSGKTGSMLAIINEFNQPSSPHRVDLDNVFIFTGHSSTEWTNQTRARFPKSMESRILHRNQLKKFIKMVQGLDNILILFDESHIAAKYGQTLYLLYKKLGFFNIKRLYSKNIKIVHFTATPDSLINHVGAWQNSLKVLQMQVPDNYISVDHYLHNNQVFEAQPLLGDFGNIQALLKHINLDDTFYHIIRTPRGHKHHDLLNDFKLYFKSFDFQFISEPSFKHDIYSLLLHKPTKHTFIFIIDKLRCAKSIHIQHAQIFYERYVINPNRDSIIQGLAGRCTGYHLHTNHIRLFSFITALQITSIHAHEHAQYNIFAPF